MISLFERVVDGRNLVGAVLWNLDVSAVVAISKELFSLFFLNFNLARVSLDKIHSGVPVV